MNAYDAWLVRYLLSAAIARDWKRYSKLNAILVELPQDRYEAIMDDIEFAFAS